METAHSERLLAIIAREEPRLRALPDEETARRPAPGKWCSREILGHVIDSASNNHQRFVRAQLGADLSFPGYAQDDWVRTQAYEAEPWADLVTLWAALNRHLAHMVGSIPASRLSTPCSIGGKPPITLEALIADYVRHLEHHLEQIR
jgi:hypothetical protein